MNKSRGFTIIELVVVMAVFLFVVGAAISIFLSIVTNQKKLLSEVQILNQISYVEERMSKALRQTATDTAGSCSGGSSGSNYVYVLTHYNSSTFAYQGIKFINETDGNLCQEFYLDSSGVLQEVRGAVAAVPLTSSDLKINSIRFALNGYDGSVGQTNSIPNCTGSTGICGVTASVVTSSSLRPQPRVTISMRVTVPGDSQEPVRTIQTTVSQRDFKARN